jgi:hypothetical protein
MNIRTSTPVVEFAAAPSQETVWEFIKYFSPDDPGKAKFNVIQVVTIDAQLEPAVLRDAVGDLTRRHDALRMRFASVDCDPVLALDPALDPPLQVVDLRALPERERSRRVAELSAYERYRDFDLLNGPLWQVSLIRLSAQRSVLIVCFFHMIADGWSVGVFLDDLDAAYRARAGLQPERPPPSIGFRDVLERQHRLRAQPNTRARYWAEHLTPLPGELPFPVVSPSGDLDLQGEGQRRFAFSGDVAERVRSLAMRARTTPFTVLLAAYQLVLARRSDRRRITIGSTTLGRNLPDTTAVIGQFTNNIYLALHADPDESFMDHIAKAHHANTAALRNVASFTEIAEAVNPRFREERPWPFLHLFDAWFQSAVPTPEGDSPAGSAGGGSADGGPADGEPGSETPAEPAGGDATAVQHHPEWAPVTTPERLPLWIRRGAPGVVVDDDRRGGVVLYNPTFFDHDMVAELAAQFQQAVGSLSAAPESALRDVRLW